MAAQLGPDRRGRAVRGSSGLRERHAALEAIEQLLDAAANGSGRALLIEGHAGMGKTRLYEAALDGARGRQMRVLRGAGAELERNVTLGLATQLLEAQLGELQEPARGRVLAEAPKEVRALLGKGKAQSGSAGDLAISHGLFAILAEDERPALIAIDDLHWSDPASLEFVLYMLHRLEELPLGILLTQRAGDGADVSDVLDRIATHPRVNVEPLPPLGRAAVAEVVTEILEAEAADELVDACCASTRGNPFYLHELLLALRAERDGDVAELVDRARAMAPDAVARSLRVRIGRLGSEAAWLAAAVAILGDDVPLRHAAVLTGLDLTGAANAAGALAASQILLDREPLKFVHPLVRHSVLRDIPGAERAGRHLDAARLLDAEDAGPERVAAHLLRGRTEGDAWVVETLRAAAREAQSHAAARSAVEYLRRALEEPPSGEVQCEVLAELGIAEAAAGIPSAAAHLAEARAGIRDPGRRAELALELGRALENQGLHKQAFRAFEDGLRELPAVPAAHDEIELRDQLQIGWITSGTLVPALQPHVLERSEGIVRRAPAVPRSQGQRLLLAYAGQRAAFNGEPAPTVIDFAERAWDGGKLVEQAAAIWVGWRIAATDFLMAGALERAAEVAGTAIKDAQRRGWPLGFATASFIRALPLLWCGHVDQALADLGAARDAQRYGWTQFIRAATAHYVLCLIERGALDEAEDALADHTHERRDDLEDALCVYSRAELCLAQGKLDEALEAALEAGSIVERHVEFFGYCPWRTTAALAAVGLGQRDRAIALAQAARTRAEHIQVLHQEVRTLRVLGICQGGEEGTQLLRAAVSRGLDAQPRLETLRALVDLGAALRRGNQRAEAREPLQRAADWAQEVGACALRDRALTELAATGARPRRDTFMTGPAALTPSERRIADRAAAGASNREIAQSLFVTPKTVEYHLRNTYRKLGIDTRRELAAALAE